MITDLKIIKNIEYLFEYKLIIYGAGTSGQNLLNELLSINASVAAFCDTFAASGTVCNTPVLNQTDLKEVLDSGNEKFLIIIASTYHNEIYEDLTNKNITGEGIVSSFAIRHCIYLNIDHPHIPSDYRDHYKNMIALWKTIQLNAVCAKKTQDDFFALTNILEHDLVLLYQPGKVGSISIQKSLQRVGIRHQHVHILNNRIMADNSSYAKLLKQLKHKQTTTKIITGIREPIARGISSFIHNLTQYNGWLMQDELTNDLCESCVTYLRNYTCNDNKASAEDSYSFNKNEFTAPSDQMGNEFAWFDKEIKTLFGIDIFDYPFDKEKGYTVIKQDNIEIFVYKLEKLDSLESALSEFLGTTEILVFEKDNVVDEKVTKNLTKEIKSAIQIPKDCLEYYFVNNPQMQHFYTESEIEQFYKKYNKEGK